MARLSVRLKVVKDLELHALGHKVLMNFSWEKKEHDERDIFEKLICVPLIAYATFYYNRSIYSHVFTSKSQAS